MSSQLNQMEEFVQDNADQCDNCPNMYMFPGSLTLAMPPLPFVFDDFPAHDGEDITEFLDKSRDLSQTWSAGGRGQGQSNDQSLKVDWFTNGTCGSSGQQNSYQSLTNTISENAIFDNGFAPGLPTYHSEVIHSHSHTPPNTCSSCYAHFGSNTALQEHSKQAGHSSYECLCGSGFSRVDSLNRHVRDFLPGAYPCTFCTRHVGNAAFKRKYHLTQHLKGYHKMGRETLRILLQDGEQDGGKQ